MTAIKKLAELPKIEIVEFLNRDIEFISRLQLKNIESFMKDRKKEKYEKRLEKHNLRRENVEKATKNINLLSKRFTETKSVDEKIKINKKIASLRKVVSKHHEEWNKINHLVEEINN